MHPQRSLYTSLLGIWWWSIASGLLPLAVYSQTSLQPKPIVPPRTHTPPDSPQSDRTLEQFQVYRLDTGDGLNISVPLFPEFSAVVTIDPQGDVIMPILGRISLAGLTLNEVEAKIAYELSDRFLQEPPEVFASLTAPRPAQISILGQVVKPGFYGFISGSPLTAALLAAGGSTDDADLRSITVRRTLVDGSQIQQNVDLYTPLITAKALPDISLQGGDVIIVNKLKLGEDRNYDRTLVAQTTLPQQTIQVRVLVPASTGTAFRNLVLPNGSTLIDAISSLPPDDNLLIKEEIALLRFDPKTGKIDTQQLNTQDVIQGSIAQDIPLQNEDVIVVSRTLLGKIFNAFNVITQPIRTLFGFRSFINDVFDTNN
jgi:polysaccharide biosynthesis/export protein